MPAWKQIVLSVIVIVVAGAGWFVFDRREQLFGAGNAATGDSSARRNGGVPGIGGEGTPAAANQPGQGGGGGAGRGGPIPVTAEAVEVDDSGSEVRAIGTLAAAQEVTIFAEATGIVKEIAFTPGTEVAAGQVLVRLEDSDQQLAVEKAEMALAGLRATLERTERLAETQNATQVAVTEARSAEAQAALDLRGAELELAKRTIKAPFAGTVGLTDLSVGDLVNSSKAIANLADTSTATVAFDVPERVSAMVTDGQAVTATSTAVPGDAITGKIVAIDNRVDPETRTLQLRAALPNEGHLLKPGMAVTVTLEFAGKPRPSVPSMAIQWDRLGSFVWRIDGDVVHRMPVQIIARRSGEVTVAADLKAGDQVVTEGVLRLREGLRVVRVDDTGSGELMERKEQPGGAGEAAASDGGRSG